MIINLLAPLVFTLPSVSALLPATLAVAQPLRFASLCAQREDLPAAERHTIEVLLETAETNDCNVADKYLHGLERLRLDNRQIKSLAPLTSLTQLRVLSLGNNEVEDIGPLSALTNLQTLDLSKNQIRNLSPLTSLTRLEILSVDENRIENIKPIARLYLTELYIKNNWISDLSPLSSLTTLTNLDLISNRIELVEPLAQLVELKSLRLSGNAIRDISSLSPLQQLIEFELRNLPLRIKGCPVYPATICAFSDDAAELYQTGQQQSEGGDLDGAQTTFEAALQVYRTTGNRLRESDALDQIGNLYAERGEYANALDYYQQSQAVRQAIGDPQGDVDSLAYLGETYIRLGQTERAIALLKRALEQYQPIPQGTDRRSSDREGQGQEGLIFRALALAYSRSDNLTQALRFAKLSLADYRKNSDDAGEAIALSRVGEAYLELGNLDKARLYLTKALEISQAANDPTAMARSHYGLGQLAVRQDEVSEALTQYDQALYLWHNIEDGGDSTDNTYVSGEAETLSAKGELLLQNKPEDAAIVLRDAVLAWEQQRPGLTDADKISIIETQSHTYRLLQQALVAVGNSDQALEVSEQGRSRAFAELLAHRLSLRGEPLPDQQVQPPSIEKIKAIAQAQDAILVEYSLVEDELYIWVIEPTGQIHFRQSPIDKPLADWVIQSRRALGIPGVLLRSAGIEVIGRNPLPSKEVLYPLHQLLIEPISDVLHGENGANHNTPVVIIPHDALFLVPFAALPDENNTALIEKHPLLFAPAIGLLNVSPQRSPLRVGTDAALVVGDPKMPNRPGSIVPWNQLPGARREAEQVSPLLSATPLIDTAATEKAVVSQMQTASIVHLATHGLLDDLDTGIPGALALAPTDDDDGYLTAAEITDLSMSARLVVLSACDTGQGRITGDGVIGLSRSFLTAGVESLVVTLWAIPDGPTAELMEEFYRQLQQQPNRAIALQQAMLATRDRYPDDPARWAAFTLFGAAE